MGRGKPWKPEQVEAAVRMRKMGMTTIEIGHILGKSAGSVSDVVRRRGVLLTEEQRYSIYRANSHIGLQRIRELQPARAAKWMPDDEPSIDPATATLRFEVAYCEAADRNGWPICGYEAAA